MHPFIRPLRKSFVFLADKDIARGQEAYMKNLFPFFGIKTDERRAVTKAYFKEQGILDEQTLYAVVSELWSLPQREFQYTGQELLHAHRKHFTVDTIACIEQCIIHKSWWDTVDALNTTAAGIYFEQYPQKIKAITGRWNRSGNMWLNRSSLLFQLKYKARTDTALLGSYIENLAGSKEFFIRKAIGWTLREYAKTDPKWVRSFVESHELSGLSVREALKHLG